MRSIEPGISRFRVRIFDAPRNDGVALRRPNVFQERVDFRAQHVGLAAQRTGGVSTSPAAVPASVEPRRRRRCCWRPRWCHRRHAGCCARSRASPHPAPRPAAAIAVVTSLISLIVVADVPDGADCRIRHRRMLTICWTDFVGGLCGLVGEALDLGGDHGESAGRPSPARAASMCVERQQIGLRGDGLDQVDHHA